VRPQNMFADLPQLQAYFEHTGRILADSHEEP
jgi:hypothetical protein